MGIFGRRSQDRDFEEAEYADDEYDQGEYGEYDAGHAEEDYPEDYYDGPYDEAEAPDDGLNRLDLGSVRLPLPDGAQIQVEMDPSGNGALRAVNVLTPSGQFTISAYAAPRSSRLWQEISRELAEQLHGDGARVRRENGEWGPELVAFVNNVLLRFVGVDGPRWMLRAVSAGPKEQSAKAAELLRNIVRSTVVVRGEQPMPVRTPLPLTLPEHLAERVEQARSGQS